MMNLIYAVVMLIISYVLTPRPKTQNASVQAGEVPTASADDPIPVVFGEVELAQTNVVWWGHARTHPIQTDGGKK